MIGFLVKAGLFYIVWQVVYDLVIYPDGRLDQFLAVSVAILAKMAWPFLDGISTFGIGCSL